jgi:hypothetical protein
LNRVPQGEAATRRNFNDLIGACRDGDRRLVRPTDVPTLPPIRSLAYFLPVIEELLVHSNIAGQKINSADVQKNTFSDDR